MNPTFERTPGAIARGRTGALAESPSRDAIIAIQDLRVEYPSADLRGQKKVAVKRLSLSVYRGEVFGFLGPNAPVKPPP